MNAAASNERVAYFNGDIVPESQVKVSFRDRSFTLGDGVFDMTRTFGHRIFRIEEHVERLYRSLQYVKIDPGLPPAEMVDKSRQVLEANRHLLGEDDDYWVAQRVTRGVQRVDGDIGPNTDAATVIIACTPLPLAARARIFRDGIDVVVPSVRRTPPESFSPRVKSHNYLNLIMADLEAKAHTDDAWAILLDMRGFLTEGIGSNIFTVKNGALHTPRPQFILEGVSRQTVCDLAGKMGIDVVERDIDLYDLLNADEAFLTSTSLCICGVRSANGRQIGDGAAHGPITKKLMQAYVDYVEFDWVAQYLNRLEE